MALSKELTDVRFVGEHEGGSGGVTHKKGCRTGSQHPLPCRSAPGRPERRQRKKTSKRPSKGRDEGRQGPRVRKKTLRASAVKKHDSKTSDSERPSIAAATLWMHPNARTSVVFSHPPPPPPPANNSGHRSPSRSTPNPNGYKEEAPQQT